VSRGGPARAGPGRIEADDKAGGETGHSVDDRRPVTDRVRAGPVDPAVIGPLDPDGSTGVTDGVLPRCQPFYLRGADQGDMNDEDAATGGRRS
jgi:hypothetical protein